jgi:hypothetical protein
MGRRGKGNWDENDGAEPDFNGDGQHDEVVGLLDQPREKPPRRPDPRSYVDFVETQLAMAIELKTVLQQRPASFLAAANRAFNALTNQSGKLKPGTFLTPGELGALCQLYAEHCPTGDAERVALATMVNEENAVVRSGAAAKKLEK